MIDWKKFWTGVDEGHAALQRGALVGLGILSAMVGVITLLDMDFDLASDVNPLPSFLKFAACCAITVFCCYLYSGLKTVGRDDLG